MKQIKAGSEFIWVWVAIEPKNKVILVLSISKERNMFVIAERFPYYIVKEYRKYPVPADGANGIHNHANYKLELYTHSSYEKSLIERTIQYIKDRIESFDDHFPCKKRNAISNI